MNYVEIFTGYAVPAWFSNSLTSRCVATVDRAAARHGHGLCLRARYNTGGPALCASASLPARCCRRSSSCCRCSACSCGRADAEPHRDRHRASGIHLPFLAWMLVAFFEGDVRRLEEAARVDGATRWQAFRLIAVPVGGAGHPRRRPARLHPELERVPVRADPVRQPDTQTLPVGLAALETHAGRRDRAAGRGHSLVAPARCSCCCRSCADT